MKQKKMDEMDERLDEQTRKIREREQEEVSGGFDEGEVWRKWIDGFVETIRPKKRVVVRTSIIIVVLIITIISATETKNWRKF